MDQDLSNVILKMVGLAKPAPEHTYAVVSREFLCDCQLDLEYASVLKQISSCGEKSHYDMTLHFSVKFGLLAIVKTISTKNLQKLSNLN